MNIDKAIDAVTDRPGDLIALDESLDALKRWMRANPESSNYAVLSD